MSCVLVDVLVLDHLRLKRARAGDGRIDWLAGLPTVFPPGTYWLRRFAGVPIAAIA